MRATMSLFRREFGAYFLSPIAYVIMALFLALTGYLFWLVMGQLTAGGPQGVAFPMQLMVTDNLFWLGFLFIPPLLTMRLFAEERSTGTLEMLLTAPLRDWQIVLSKYLACLAFYVVLWLPTLAYLPVLTDFSAGAWWDPRTWHSEIDPWPIVSTYLGLFLVGAMFLALGMFVSTLVKSQMVAALISLFAALVFVGAGFWKADTDTGSALYQILFYFTVPMHFESNFSRGLVDTRQLVFYSSVALFFVFLSIRSLESRRWR